MSGSVRVAGALGPGSQDSPCVVGETQGSSLENLGVWGGLGWAKAGVGSAGAEEGEGWRGPAGGTGVGVARRCSGPPRPACPLQGAHGFPRGIKIVLVIGGNEGQRCLAESGWAGGERGHCDPGGELPGGPGIGVTQSPSPASPCRLLVLLVP